MPSNRTKKTRKRQAEALTPELKDFLLYGYKVNQRPVNVHLMILSRRPDEIQKLWGIHGDTLLKEWERSGNPGLPWASRFVEDRHE